MALPNDTPEDAQFQMISELAAFDLLKQARAKLKPFEYALLSYYVMTYGIDGLIVEALRDTAKACQMSLNKARDARQALVDAGYIALQVFDITEYRNGQTPVVTVEPTSNSMQGTSHLMYASERVMNVLRLMPHAGTSDVMDGGTSKTVGKRVKDSVGNDTTEVYNHKHISAAKNAALVGASPPHRNLWYDCIKTVWNYSGALNGEMEKMLRGVSKDPAFKKGNVPGRIQLSPDDVLRWAAWYRHVVLHDNPDLNMLAGRMEVASSIETWYDAGRPSADDADDRDDETYFDAHGAPIPRSPMAKILAGLDIPNLQRQAVHQ